MSDFEVEVLEEDVPDVVPSVTEIVFQQIGDLWAPLVSVAHILTLETLEGIGLRLRSGIAVEDLKEILLDVSNSMSDLYAEPTGEDPGLVEIFNLFLDWSDLVTDLTEINSILENVSANPDSPEPIQVLLEALVGSYLLRNARVIVGGLYCLGIVDIVDPARALTAPTYYDPSLQSGISLRVRSIVDFLSDPIAFIRTTYRWDELRPGPSLASFAVRLFGRIGFLINMLGQVATLEGDRLVLAVSAAGFQTGVTMQLIAINSTHVGLAIAADRPIRLTVELGEYILRLNAELPSVGVVISSSGVRWREAGHSGVLICSVIMSSVASPSAWLSLGGDSGTRLTIGSLSSSLSLRSAATNVVTAELQLRACEVVVSGDDSDGFLGQSLPRDAFRARFDLTLGWRSDSGFYINGSLGFSVRLPISLTLPFLELQDCLLELALDGSRNVLWVQLGFNVLIRLGPVQVSIKRVGVASGLSFGQGNLGISDVSIGFLRPAGLGVVVEAGSVQGGGEIVYEDLAERYSGYLVLRVGDIAIFAAGILDTKPADGRSGYSFLVVITAEFPGIPIGFGFNLSGVGGLVGINRQVSTDALQRGVQDGSLARILFPSRDALRNPANVLAGIQRVFPPAQDSNVVAPLVKITWGKPAVVEIVLGIIIRFPEVLVSLLGRVSVGIPDFSRDAPVRINLLIAGVMDPAQKLIDIRTTLYDSRITNYTLAGDMAFRMRWGDQPDFLISFGGFHPRYRAPAGFPALRRLSVSIGNDAGARLTVEAFLAVTSNTFQFGARAMADLEVASIFSVHGEIYVYGMVTFSPFSFRLDFGVHLTVSGGGMSLFAVRCEGFIEGPGPWRIQGRASISLWLFEASADFDLRFGSPAQPPRPLPVPDVLPRLVEAFQEEANWRPELAEGAERVVTLGKVEGDVPIFDPMGGLAVRQKVCPLNRPLRRLEQVDLAAPRTFRVRNLLLGGVPLSDTQAQAVQEWFAPGQYQPLSQAEQLSAESFVPMDAGFSLVQDEVAVGTSEPVDLGFEPILVQCDEPEGAPTVATPSACGTRPELHVPTASAVFAQVRQQARVIRQSSGSPVAYLPETLVPLVTMAPELHAIARADTLMPVATAAMVGATDAYVARDRLQAWEDAHPDDRGRYQVVSVYLTRRAA